MVMTRRPYILCRKTLYYTDPLYHGHLSITNTSVLWTPLHFEQSSFTLQNTHGIILCYHTFLTKNAFIERILSNTDAVINKRKYNALWNVFSRTSCIKVDVSPKVLACPSCENNG